MSHRDLVTFDRSSREKIAADETVQSSFWRGKVKTGLDPLCTVPPLSLLLDSNNSKDGMAHPCQLSASNPTSFHPPITPSILPSCIPPSLNLNVYVSPPAEHDAGVGFSVSVNKGSTVVTAKILLL